MTALYMSNYNKTAPVMGILVFLCTYKTREIIKASNKKNLLCNPVSGGRFYAILIYITLFYNLELTTAGGFFFYYLIMSSLFYFILLHLLLLF